jgi:hypothetical protein
LFDRVYLSRSVIFGCSGGLFSGGGGEIQHPFDLGTAEAQPCRNGRIAFAGVHHRADPAGRASHRAVRVGLGLRQDRIRLLLPFGADLFGLFLLLEEFCRKID